MLNLNDLKVGDSVRFKNGQVAKVVEITGKNEQRLCARFNKEVACDVDDVVASYSWNYYSSGECIGCTNNIVEIIKKGEKTMNKKKIEKSLEWHKRKIAELEEALKDSESKRWFPKKDEEYYGIFHNEVLKYANHNEKCTKNMYSVNNVFKTKEEAEKELSRRKAETELLDMCDWTPDCDRMWVIFHDKNTSHFDVDYYFSRQHAPYNFASEESAQKAIDTLGEEKLKLIFRI